MRLAICVATMQPEIKHPDQWMLQSMTDIPILRRHNTAGDNLGIVKSYHWLYEHVTLRDRDVLCYLHDDVICREQGWDERVLKEFEDERVAVAGFGGAEWHGTDDLYKRPYQLSNLRRGGYGSNVDDAEVHGERFTGSKDVAVLDGFALCVRRSFLDRIGGWSLVAGGCDFYCYDYAICALARRYGYRIRLIGVRCHHLGGRTSTQGVKGVTGQEEYERSHRWFYEEFRDAMPCRVNGVKGS